MSEELRTEVQTGPSAREDLGDCDNGCGPAVAVFEVTDKDGDTHTIRLCQKCLNAYHHDSN